jgi:RHS repeat-associated protein
MDIACCSAFAYGSLTSSAALGSPSAFPPNNPWKFSTKYWDVESGLGYWGYRYYEPKRGQWLVRDRLGERMLAGLYAYVGGRPTSDVDVLGDLVWSPPSPCQVRMRYATLSLVPPKGHAGLDLDWNGDGIPDVTVDYGYSTDENCHSNTRYPFPIAGLLPPKSVPGPWGPGGPWFNPSCLCNCLANDLPNQYGPPGNYGLLGIPPKSNSNGAIHAAIMHCEQVCGTKIPRPYWAHDLWLPGWDNVPKPYY